MASKNRPDFLKAGDKISIVASARKVSQEDIAFSIQLFESWGLEVVLDELLFASDFQFAGSDEIRAQNIQNSLDNPNIKAIVFARGGYGSVRVIDKLDFTKFRKDPKWLVGFSDITVFHSHLNRQIGFQSIHATMPLSMNENTLESLQTLKLALFGNLPGYSFTGDYAITKGSCEGEIVGGNLSLIQSLLNSSSDVDYKGKILFIEDLDEMLYHLDRMIICLKRADIFKEISGLIVGGMSDMRDTTTAFGFASDNPFGKNAKEIIQEHCSDLGIPVCFGLPFGHEKDNRALYLGRTSKFIVNRNEVSIDFK